MLLNTCFSSISSSVHKRKNTLLISSKKSFLNQIGDDSQKKSLTLTLSTTPLYEVKGSNYREPKYINRKHNFKILTNSVEDDAIQLTKHVMRT